MSPFLYNESIETNNLIERLLTLAEVKNTSYNEKTPLERIQRGLLVSVC